MVSDYKIKERMGGDWRVQLSHLPWKRHKWCSIQFPLHYNGELTEGLKLCIINILNDVQLLEGLIWNVHGWNWCL